MKRPCKHPGCPALLIHSGYCERHKQIAPNKDRDYDLGARSSDPALAFARKVRSSARWRSVRLAKLAAQPLCENPLGVHKWTATATQVHHVKGLATHPELAYDIDNLMSLCTRCHAAIEAREKRNQ